MRPANYLECNPGRGHTVVEKDGLRLGRREPERQRVHAAPRAPRSTWPTRCSPTCAARPTHVLVDFHAEATSEKVAMGWHLDGRVLAVLGTHTHVPTADARVLPGGTAYITDVGMTGARGGVIGVKREQVIERFVTQMPVRFETAEEDPWVMGCWSTARPDGLRDVDSSRCWCRRSRDRQPPKQRDQHERQRTTRCRGRTSASTAAGARSAPPRRAPRPERRLARRGTNATSSASPTAPTFTRSCSQAEVRPGPRC